MTNDGGPAFPHEFKFGDGSAERHKGMTLRDYFAAKAMQTLAVIPFYRSTAGVLSEYAYMIADAMLAERAKRA